MIKHSPFNMRRSQFLLPLMIITLSSIIYVSCSKSSVGCDASVDCSGVTFSGTIQPLAASKCALSGCHGGSFDSYANLSAIADNGSLLREVVTTENMPTGNINMSCEERAQFECWINDGAPNN